jgi:hypothetical protein
MPVRQLFVFGCYPLDDMTGENVFRQFPDLPVSRQVDACDGSCETTHVEAWPDTPDAIETLQHLGAAKKTWKTA